jgi:multiple sugar transport system permease protein
MYKEAFGSFQIGYGTAISMIILVIGVVLSLFYVKVSKVKV